MIILFPGLTLAQEQEHADVEFLEPVDGAQNVPVDEYFKGVVLEIVEQTMLGPEDSKQLFQNLKVKVTSGSEKDKEVIINNVGGSTINGGKGFIVGEKIVINKTTLDGESEYYVVDVYRVPSLIVIAIIFLLVVVVVSRWRGLASVLGLVVTIAVILNYVAPQIIAGKNPLTVCLVAAAVIALTSLYFAHGFNKRTSVAVVSTFITLAISVVLAVIFVSMSKLFGNGSEEAVFLQIGQTQNINLQGLLLGGIILGALGVLDDITTGQAATVDELKKANPSLTFKQLYSSASSVGREHISSLINTLFLAYAGVSLPLFLLFQLSGETPIWATLNSEFISEEIIRTLVGSITLILAVPITTLLASYYFTKNGPTDVESKHIH